MAPRTSKDWYRFFANLEVNMVIQGKNHVVAYARRNKCKYYRMAKKEESGHV